MKSKLCSLMLPVCILTSTNTRAQEISSRFVPEQSSAALVGQWALWQNPGGMAFLSGSESAVSYLYENNTRGNRHRTGLNLVFNMFDSLSLGAGFNTQAAMSAAAKDQLGTKLTGILGGALMLGPSMGFGVSVLKSYNFKSKNDTGSLFSFGFQSRLASFLSVGGFYEEVHSGFLKAPNLTSGLALRPFGSALTFGFDARFSPRGEEWDDGFRFDPILSLKGEYKGLAASVSALFPGIEKGLTPQFSVGLELNLAHIGLNAISQLDTKEGSYAIGGFLRGSSAEWPTVSKPKDLWVKLAIDSKGQLESGQLSLAAQLFGREGSPLAVLAMLRRLKSDPMIKGVIINFDGLGFGDARAQEWWEALSQLKAANKRVIVYLQDPSEIDYYVATAADQIFLNPSSVISLSRLQTTLVHFADLLKKVGIEAEATNAGTKKTATRPFTHKEATKEEIDASANILDSFYNSLIEKVSTARKIEPNKVKEIFNDGAISASRAQEVGLVDSIFYADEVEENVDNGHPLSIFSNYEQRTVKNDQWVIPKKIGVIEIRGEIVDGRVYPTIVPGLSSRRTGAKDVIDTIDELVEDPDIVAIIVRIDSPGGSASAGSDITRALRKAQEKKPFVASMSDYAASAGYMIATGTNHILAEKNTVTGSIGVWSMQFSAAELAKKIGVNTKEISAIKNPGGTLFRGLTAKEREEAQKLVDWYYQNFIATVALGINLDESEVKKNADGQVWLGYEALSKKLVDGIGGFSEAIDVAKKLAKVDEKEEVLLDLASMEGARMLLNNRLLSYFRAGSPLDDIPLSHFARPYLKALEVYRLEGIPQARLPFELVKFRDLVAQE